jgi:hypothetical protein
VPATAIPVAPTSTSPRTTASVPTPCVPISNFCRQKR